MGALDRSTAHVQRRAYPSLDRERFRSDRGADDVYHGIDRADFMKVDALDGCGMNLGFRLAQRFENADRSCLSIAADRRLFDDLANLGQASSVFVFVSMLVRATLRMAMTMIVIMAMGVFRMRVRMIMPVLLLQNFPWQIFFSVGVHIDLGRCNPATRHPRNLQPRADIKRRNGVFQKLGRHSGVDDCSEEHVAADSGKTIEVGYAHGKIAIGG